MYGTLGAGFMGMMAIIAAALGLIGAVLLALHGHYVFAVVVFGIAFVVAQLFSKAEKRHVEALRKSFDINTK